jgi:hypothetical protein
MVMPMTGKLSVIMSPPKKRSRDDVTVLKLN